MLPHYVADPAVATLVLNWTARVSALAFVLFLFVAQYDAWTEQREKRIRAEQELDLVSQTGPEVWLGFESSHSYVGFTIENRSLSRDAMQISVDPFETNSYRAAPSTLPLLRRGDTQALTARMADKRHDISLIDIDLGEMLKDSGDSFNGWLQFVLHYSDSWGNRFVRRVTVDANRLGLALDNLPQLVNHPIKRDCEELMNPTDHRTLVPRGETITNRPVISVDKRSVKVS